MSIDLKVYSSRRCICSSAKVSTKFKLLIPFGNVVALIVEQKKSRVLSGDYCNKDVDRENKKEGCGAPNTLPVGRNAIQGKDGECKKRGICLEEEMGRNKKSAR